MEVGQVVAVLEEARTVNVNARAAYARNAGYLRDRQNVHYEPLSCL
jgi:hypothetical protein